MPNLLADDLEHAFQRTKDLWESVRGARLFVTGGTGFFGCWLLETFLTANERLALGAQVTVLGRDYNGFVTKAPHLATHPRVDFRQGDVRTFEFPEGEFEYVVHAAADSTAPLTPANQSNLLSTIVGGTHRVLEFARKHGARKMLFVGSGAVYGHQPEQMNQIPEEHEGAPANYYGEGKRAAEELCLESELDVSIARGFAFVGPYLPLNAHFAAGNFIGDLLVGAPIYVTGDGTARRSYLYAADLAAWLWTILFRGEPKRAYNVGSESEVSIAELARVVAECQEPSAEIRFGAEPVSGAPAQRYIPSTLRAREELGLEDCFSLQEAIRRTIRYHRRLAEADSKLDGKLWQKFRSEMRLSAKAGHVTSSRNSESITTAA